MTEHPRSWRPLYQMIYDRSYYGRDGHGFCPGCLYYPLYQHWLYGDIIDLGCGSGDTVQLMKSNGFNADGMDFIKLPNKMLQGDIGKPHDLSKYKTSTCFDVLEHLDDKTVAGLCENMQQTSRQIFTVHVGPSKWRWGTRNLDLHINQKPVIEWHQLLDQYFTIRQISSLDLLDEKPLRYLILATH